MTSENLTLPNGETISYALERRPRRTIGLKITEDGLVVHAPKRIYAYELNRILIEKSDWILRKLAARKENYVPPISWIDGDHLQYFGNTILLKITAHAKNKKPTFINYILRIETPEANNHAVIQRKVTQWYKEHALHDFSRRIEVLAAKLGVPTPPLLLSNASSRWGSCSSSGVVRLNWRLMQAPPHIINYVVCHELAHLKQLNHSAKFWAVVEGIYPDYKQAEKELSALSPLLHRL